jgi:hypothetical protein
MALQGVAATIIAGARVPSSWVSPYGSVKCDGDCRCTSSIIVGKSVNGSVRCGGDWHCWCVPPIVAGKSERLCEVWQRLTLPV